MVRIHSPPPGGLNFVNKPNSGPFQCGEGRWFCLILAGSWGSGLEPVVLERDRNGQRREKMILPRVFVFSMSRPTFRPTLSIFILLCTITGCGARPRKCVWQGGGVSRRLDKRDAGLLRKEKFSPPDTSGTNPREVISPPFKMPLSNPRSKSSYEGPHRLSGCTRSTAFGNSPKSAHRRGYGDAVCRCSTPG